MPALTPVGGWGFAEAEGAGAAARPGAVVGAADEDGAMEAVDVAGLLDEGEAGSEVVVALPIQR